MVLRMIKANNADELFNKVSDVLLGKRSEFNVNHFKDGPIYSEIINVNLLLTDPTHNTMCDCYRKMSMRYAIGELVWYNSRNNYAKSINDFSTFWEKIADKGGTVNSNYGWCIHDKYDFDQWEFVKNTLKKDSGSRQAVIHIKEPRNLLEYPTKDVNCTISLQFLLRKKLDLIVTMRSTDLWLGLPYDLFNFTCMQMQMAMELNVKVGRYYHNAGSLHLYNRDVEKLKINKEKSYGV